MDRRESGKPSTTKRTMRLLFHTLGVSCLASAVILEVWVFSDIVQHGYFYARESNPYALTLEVLLSIYALIYFIYVFYRFLRGHP